jgi:hypothetical protein
MRCYTNALTDDRATGDLLEERLAFQHLSHVPVDIQMDAHESRITVTTRQDYEGVCTSDLAPYTSVVRLPEQVDSSQHLVLVIQERGKRDVRLRL